MVDPRVVFAALEPIVQEGVIESVADVVEAAAVEALDYHRGRVDALERALAGETSSPPAATLPAPGNGAGALDPPSDDAPAPPASDSPPPADDPAGDVGDAETGDDDEPGQDPDQGEGDAHAPAHAGRSHREVIADLIVAAGARGITEADVYRITRFHRGTVTRHCAALAAEGLTSAGPARAGERGGRSSNVWISRQAAPAAADPASDSGASDEEPKEEAGAGEVDTAVVLRDAEEWLKDGAARTTREIHEHLGLADWGWTRQKLAIKLAHSSTVESQGSNGSETLWRRRIPPAERDDVTIRHADRSAPLGGRILSAMILGPKTVPQLAAELVEPPAVVAQEVRKLIAEDEVKKDAGGRYERIEL